MKEKHGLRWLIILLTIYVVFGAILYVMQRSFIYHPTPDIKHNYQQIVITNNNVELDVMVLNAGNSEALIYFGGNAEQVINNADAFERNLQSQTAYLVNYRGYGRSTGTPTEEGLFTDALAVYDYISPSHDRVAVMGRSLGSGVAMYLAVNRDVSHTVLITPYDSVLALAKQQYPIYPMSLMLKDHFDSISLAESVRSPVLVIAGGKDSLIPLNHSKKLVTAIGKQQVTLVVIDNAGHNNISQFSVYFQRLRSFLGAG